MTTSTARRSSRAPALLNALEIVGKKIDEVKVVFSGAGAAGIACAKFYVTLGVKRENLILVDTKGVVYKGRKEGMNKYKEIFALETNARTLAEAMKGADVFAGVSVKGVVTKDMVQEHGEGSDHLRHGQPRSRNHV